MKPALAIAALCAGLVLAWQFLTVRANGAGDWTSLYYTGAFTRVPPALEDEGVYRFQNSAGFDGQYYHFIAHDPLLRKDYAPYVDNPRLRWRRILVPALAYLAALGRSDFVDSAYVTVIVAFIFLGAYWLARYCARFHLHPGWGLLFALVPAVLVSIDRATVDVSLAALCVGYALYACEPGWRIYPILALAPLARETGACLPLAFLLAQRSKRRALAAATTLVPYAAWLLYLDSRTTADHTVFASLWPLQGLLGRTLHPLQYAVTSRWLRTAAALDYLAVLGIWLALVLTARLLWKRKLGPLELAAAGFGCVAVLLAQPQAWAETYAFGRTMSPLLICLGLSGIAARAWWNLAPLAMVLPRVLFQLQPQWTAILRGFLPS